MRIKDVGELRLIKRLTKGMGLDSSVIKGPGDDAAVIKWDSHKYLLYTCDMLVEGVHFNRNAATPFQIGRKAMGRNISDIAAMGGLGRYAVVSMALPPELDVLFVDGINKGMKSLSARYGINIVGGDVSSSANIMIDVSLIGEVEKAKLVMRSGAKEGDLIFVTGSIGGSKKGRHLDFVPRLEESRALVGKFRLSSMIDITDGLLLDLWRILDASRVGGTIYQNMVPLSKHAGRFDESVREGEDFELLFTMSAKEARRFSERGIKKIKTPITLIGKITGKGSGCRLIRNDGRSENISPDSAAAGWLHF